ncbi:MAG: SEC-C metal-binding domain-containing protein, partial [Alphaproteobacteria bacterium]
ARCIPEKAYPEQWNTSALHEETLRVLGMDLPVAEWAKEEGIADAEIRERLTDGADRMMAEKAANYGPEIMRSVEKSLLLQILDQMWKEHLLTLDHLRQGIGLRAYGQRDPLNEYKREAFDLYKAMLEHLRERVTLVLCHIELRLAPIEEMMFQQPEQKMTETREDPALRLSAREAAVAEAAPAEAPASGPAPPFPALPIRRRQAAPTLDPDDPATWGRVPRNAPCPCGSGKKYKHCHGRVV